MEYSETTIFITGQAKPGKDDAITSVYQTFSLSLFVDTDTDRIVNLACNTVMEETEAFIRCLLVGRSLTEELPEMVDQLQRRFFGVSQKTLIAALKDVHNRYLPIYPEKRRG